MDEETNIVVLIDEDGEEAEFEIIDMLEIDEEEYAILLPIDKDGEASEEAIILKIEEDDEGEEMLYEIENDDEWEMVAKIWHESTQEESLQ